MIGAIVRIKDSEPFAANSPQMIYIKAGTLGKVVGPWHARGYWRVELDGLPMLGIILRECDFEVI